MLSDILSPTVFQLSRSIDHIIAFDMGCLFLSLMHYALVLRNPFECRHKSHIAKI